MHHSHTHKKTHRTDPTPPSPGLKKLINLMGNLCQRTFISVFRAGFFFSHFNLQVYGGPLQTVIDWVVRFGRTSIPLVACPFWQYLILYHKFYQHIGHVNVYAIVKITYGNTFSTDLLLIIFLKIILGLLEIFWSCNNWWILSLNMRHLLSESARSAS